MNHEDKESISNFLQTITIICLVVTLIFSVLFFVVPDEACQLFDVQLEDPSIARISSAGFVAVTMICWNLIGSCKLQAIPLLSVLSWWSSIFTFALLLSVVHSEANRGIYNIIFTILFAFLSFVWISHKFAYERAAKQSLFFM